VFAPCAAAALYRRDVLLEVSGFDESYFAYLEDVDLGFRLRLAGYRCLYVPDAVVRHVGSATTGGQHSDFSVYHGHRNLVIVYFSLRGQGRVILKAKWDAIKGLPRILRERRRVQKNRRISSWELRRVMTKGLLTPYLRR
jgi:GT2 family glycosyltransferase